MVCLKCNKPSNALVGNACRACRTEYQREWAKGKKITCPPSLTEKKCSKCNLVVDISNFTKGKDRYRSQCRACRSTYIKVYKRSIAGQDKAKIKAKRIELENRKRESLTKECIRCHKSFPLFNFKVTTQGYYCSYCYTCDSIIAKEYRFKRNKGIKVLLARIAELEKELDRYKLQFNR